MSDEPRIQLADVKADIEKAFEGWISALDDDETEDPENLGDEAKDLNASHARITQFLKQTEADRAENERLRGELAEMTARAERAEGEADRMDSALRVIEERLRTQTKPIRELVALHWNQELGHAWKHGVYSSCVHSQLMMRRSPDGGASNAVVTDDDAPAERDRLRAALQSIADYRPSRHGTEAFLQIAHHCQTAARNALAAHKGGSTDGTL